VRRLQYFYRNTQLAGAVFDFHGEAISIFRGRLIAVFMLFLYNYAFGFSVTFGVLVVVFLLLSLPWMMRGALRFRLRNTSYRGLRFDFSGSMLKAYFTYWPVLFLFLLPPMILALALEWADIWLAWLGLLYFFWPWMHGRLRAYQHAHLRYANLGASYPLPATAFFKPYFFAVLLGLLAILLGGILIGLVLVSSKEVLQNTSLQILLSVAAGLMFAYLIYLFSIPYLEARIYNLTWNHTSFPRVKIHSAMPASGYIWLLAKNTLFTILSCGLYRPFAVVASWRYRLQHMHVEVENQNQAWAEQGQELGTQAAAGDGVADFLNIDLSW
jgi:uncharacterized membrane protein YjgN (DUF898 family)